MNQPISIATERSRLNRQITRLREQRGAATLDGKPVAPIDAKLSEAKRALDALADAEAEAERRDSVAAEESALASRAENIAELRRLKNARVSAVGKAQRDFRTACGSLRDVIDIADEERAFATTLHNGVRPGEFFDPTGLRPANLHARLLSYLRGGLRAAVGSTRFGGLDIGPIPGDLGGAESWSEAEERVEDLAGYFERLSAG